jgi:hypothetical protein
VCGILYLQFALVYFSLIFHLILIIAIEIPLLILFSFLKLLFKCHNFTGETLTGDNSLLKGVCVCAFARACVFSWIVLEIYYMHVVFLNPKMVVFLWLIFIFFKQSDNSKIKLAFHHLILKVSQHTHTSIPNNL